MTIQDWEIVEGGMLVVLSPGGDLYPLTASRMFDLARIQSSVCSPLAATFYRLGVALSGGAPADEDLGEDAVEAVTPARLPNGDPTPATQRLLDDFTDAYSQLCADHDDRRIHGLSASAPHSALEAARKGKPVPPQWQKRAPQHAEAKAALRARADMRRGQPAPHLPSDPPPE
jgi:hypothetical protein